MRERIYRASTGKPVRKHRIFPVTQKKLDSYVNAKIAYVDYTEPTTGGRVCDMLEGDHPVLKALSAEEREIYQWYRAGLLMREIASLLGKPSRRDYVCRVLQSIRDKIVFLWRVKVNILADEKLLEKFLSWEVTE